MATIDELKKKHKLEIEELQQSCKHPKVSQWMSEWWAPGHSTGRQVKTCEVCGKVVKTRGKSWAEGYKGARITSL